MTALYPPANISGPRHVIVGRRLNEREPDARHLFRQSIENVPVPAAVHVERRLIERFVSAVVHAEHDRDDRRLERG